MEIETGKGGWQGDGQEKRNGNMEINKKANKEAYATYHFRFFVSKPPMGRLSPTSVLAYFAISLRKPKVYLHDTTLRSQNAEQLRENGWLRCTVLYMSTVYCILSLILDLILNMILNWGPRKAGTQVRWRRPWLATRCISGYCTLADAVTRRGLLGGADFSTDRTDAWIPMGHGCPAQLRTHDYTEMLPLSECYTLTCDIGSLFSSLVSTYCTVVVHVYF